MLQKVRYFLSKLLFKIFSFLHAWYDSCNNCKKKRKKKFLPLTILSSIFHTHIAPSLSLPFIFSTTWTSPPFPPSICNLPHATYTSAVPINTRAWSHCAALWPPPHPSEHTRPEACGFSISLTQGPVAQVCDRWGLVSSADPLCCSAHLDGVRKHWLWCYSWQGWIRAELMVAGEDKRDHGYGWGAVSLCDEIWFVLYRSRHLARLFSCSMIYRQHIVGIQCISESPHCYNTEFSIIEVWYVIKCNI